MFKKKIKYLTFIPISIVAVWIIAKCVIPTLFVYSVPEEVSAFNRVLSLAIALSEYYKETGILVDTLEELGGKGKSDLYDRWGYKILYEKDTDGSVTIASFGSDGKKGGTGKQCDIIIRYDPRFDDGVYVGASSIPESSNTKHKMGYLKKEILAYFDRRGALPESLDELELSHKCFTNDTNDYWGNPILYERREGDIVLISCGADQKRGAGYEGDIVVCFRVTD